MSIIKCSICNADWTPGHSCGGHVPLSNIPMSATIPGDPNNWVPKADLETAKAENKRLLKHFRELEIAVENMLRCPGSDVGENAGVPGPGLCRNCRHTATALLRLAQPSERKP